jgi:methionyl-tRNA formyltransferase
MTKTSATIVFFGSGPVAAKSLALLSQKFAIEAVVTKPRPVHHRGSVPVLELAEERNLPVIEASNKQELSAKVTAAGVKSRVAILIDFGIIVAQDVIDSFPLGIINSHFSILPEWRGADPITFAILSGQKQTGVSLMLLVEKMDEGPLLAQGHYDISPDETITSLTDYLIELSYALLRDIVPKYLEGELQALPQEVVSAMTEKPPKVSYSRKLTKEDGMIDWHKSAAALEREVRAFLEWPKSRTTLGGKEVIITKASVLTDAPGAAKPGDIHAAKASGTLAVATGNGWLRIERLKPAGKQEMNAQAFLAGYGKLLT